MADDIPLPISFAEDEAEAQKKERSTRGAGVAVMPAMQQQVGLDLNVSQQSGKSQIKQASKAFGGKSVNVMTVELDDGKLSNKIDVNSIEDVSVASYNEINSFLVNHLNQKQLLNNLSVTLTNYNDGNIHFNMDNDSNSIKDGLVFINNYYSVKFMIYVHASDKGARFEFRRHSGSNALASAKFLGDLTAKLGIKDDTIKQEESSLIALDLNVDGLELKINENDDDKKERMMIHEALINDDYVGDLDENSENYLYSKLVEHKVINDKSTDIDHVKLLNTLCSEDLLNHKDINIVRASLLILNKFKNNELLENDKLFGLINGLLNKTNLLIDLIAVTLLNKLSIGGSWKLDKELRVGLKKSIIKIESNWKNNLKSNKTVNQEMFTNIYKALSQ